MAVVGRRSVDVPALSDSLWTNVWRQHVRQRRSDQTNADLLQAFERSGDRLAVACLRRKWYPDVGRPADTSLGLSLGSSVRLVRDDAHRVARNPAEESAAASGVDRDH